MLVWNTSRGHVKEDSLSCVRLKFFISTVKGKDLRRTNINLIRSNIFVYSCMRSNFSVAIFHAVICHALTVLW